MTTSEPIVSFPDTEITTFFGKETFVSFGYIHDLSVRYPGLSYENPIVEAIIGTETCYMVVKPNSQCEKVK